MYVRNSRVQKTWPLAKIFESRVCKICREVSRENVTEEKAGEAHNDDVKNESKIVNPKVITNEIKICKGDTNEVLMSK